MVAIKFVGLNKRKVAKKALDFWYRKYRDNYTLVDFFSKCVLKIEGSDFTITYIGPSPPYNK
ncbi:MAG: hypothetical protein ACXACY_10315 [Candidatus Hodarchaeales archaeon]|jgi:hypothetical protein